MADVVQNLADCKRNLFSFLVSLKPQQSKNNETVSCRFGRGGRLLIDIQPAEEEDQQTVAEDEEMRDEEEEQPSFMKYMQLDDDQAIIESNSTNVQFAADDAFGLETPDDYNTT